MKELVCAKLLRQMLRAHDSLMQVLPIINRLYLLYCYAYYLLEACFSTSLLLSRVLSSVPLRTTVPCTQ